MVETVEHTETGMLKTITRTDEKAKLIWKRVHELNDAGLIKLALDHDSTGQVYRFHTVETHNDFNQGTSGKTYLIDSTYMGTWSYKFIDGQFTGFGWLDSSGVQRQDRTGEVNEKGWLSSLTDVRVLPTGDTMTIVESYTYDSMDEMGNWTQRTQKNDGKVVEVLKRTYTYYEK
jgi:hypothetical protein